MSTVQPIWRDRLVAIMAGIFAVIVGYQVANGFIIIPLLVSGVALLLILSRLHHTPLQLSIVVALLAGYFVGNRGFAQLMPIPSIPILPGEVGLAMLLGIQILHRATSQASFRRLGALDWVIGIWVLFGSIRLGFDIRQHGLLAVRDFATVYYAAFFFVACNLSAQRTDSLRVLLGTLRVSTMILFPLYLLFLENQDLFLNGLSFRGVPLIYFKDDLVGAYFAIGAVLHYFRFEEARTKRNLVFSMLLVGGVFLTNNRAAALGLFVALGWMTLSGRWRFGAWLGGCGILAAVTMVALAESRFQTWRDTPLLEVYERVVSVFDPTGQGSYMGDATAHKGDNNLFRTVWWGITINETWDENPVLGLGFGYDLAKNFVRDYYADAPDDFTARSPHSILITVFARMGLLGFLAFSTIIGLTIRQSYRLRHSNSPAFAMICGAWVLLVSSCFGVVMEGPMGAIPFWVMLGLAVGATPPTLAEESSPPDAESSPEGTK